MADPGNFRSLVQTSLETIFFSNFQGGQTVPRPSYLIQFVCFLCKKRNMRRKIDSLCREENTHCYRLWMAENPIFLFIVYNY